MTDWGLNSITEHGQAVTLVMANVSKSHSQSSVVWWIVWSSLRSLEEETRYCIAQRMIIRSLGIWSRNRQGFWRLLVGDLSEIVSHFLQNLRIETISSFKLSQVRNSTTTIWQKVGEIRLLLAFLVPSILYKILPMGLLQTRNRCVTTFETRG